MTLGAGLPLQGTCRHTVTSCCQHPSPAVRQMAAEFRENLGLHLMSHVNGKVGSEQKTAPTVLKAQGKVGDELL